MTGDILYSCSACGQVSDQRQCPEHRGGSELVSGKGSTRRWRKLRAQILERDPYCRLMLLCDGSAPSTHVDHADARQAGGYDDPEQLRGCCEPCHKAKHGGKTQRLRHRSPTTATTPPPEPPTTLPPIIG